MGNTSIATPSLPTERGVFPDPSSSSTSSSTIGDLKILPNSAPIPLCAIVHPSNLPDPAEQKTLDQRFSIPFQTGRRALRAEDSEDTALVPMMMSTQNLLVADSFRETQVSMDSCFLLKSMVMAKGRTPGSSGTPAEGTLEDEFVGCTMTAVSGALSECILLGDVRGYVHLLPRPEEFSSLSSRSRSCSSGKSRRTAEAVASWHCRIDATKRPSRQRIHWSSDRRPVVRLMKIGKKSHSSSSGFSGARICSLGCNGINFWECGGVLDAVATKSSSIVRPEHLGYVDVGSRVNFFDATVADGGQKVVSSYFVQRKGCSPRVAVWDLTKDKDVVPEQMGSSLGPGQGGYLGYAFARYFSLRALPSTDSVFVKAGATRDAAAIDWHDLRSDTASRPASAVNGPVADLGVPSVLRCLTDDFVIVECAVDSRSGAGPGMSHLLDRRNLSSPVWTTASDATYSWLPSYSGNPNAVLAFSPVGGSLINLVTGKKTQLVCFRDVKAHCVSSLAEVYDAFFRKTEEEERISFLIQLVESGQFTGITMMRLVGGILGVPFWAGGDV